MASPGNHEAVCIEQSGIDELCPVGQKNFTDFMNRFGRISPRTFPSKSKNQTAIELAKSASTLALPPMWYSFEYGMAHIGASSWLDLFQIPANS
jgi:acid phosphatase